LGALPPNPQGLSPVILPRVIGNNKKWVIKVSPQLPSAEPH